MTWKRQVRERQE